MDAAKCDFDLINLDGNVLLVYDFGLEELFLEFHFGNEFLFFPSKHSHATRLFNAYPLRCRESGF